MKRKCSNCALKSLKGGLCPIFNANMKGEFGCPYFTTELHTCDICGNLILKDSFIQEEDNKFHMLCGECATSNPCKTCQYVQVCRFEQDQSCQEPPFVTTQYREGNMIVQSQQLNPKRIEATCAQGCSCYNPNSDFHCWKQTGCGCNNLKIQWRN